MAPIIPVAHSAKKALCIGIRYTDLAQKWPKEDPPFLLLGAHQDPMDMRDLLVDVYGYEKDNIKLLLDDGIHDMPTKENIEQAMKDLVKDAQPGDHFVFHFSGHGSQIKNRDGSEEDGLDEVIWPADVNYEPYETTASRIIDESVEGDGLRDLVNDPLEMEDPMIEYREETDVPNHLMERKEYFTDDDFGRTSFSDLPKERNSFTDDDSDSLYTGPFGELPKVKNYIIDDYLKQILVDHLPDGAHLTAILDCCHSGTGIDLPHSHSHSSDSFKALWSPTREGINQIPTVTAARTKGRSQLNKLNASPPKMNMPFTQRGVISLPTSGGARLPLPPYSAGHGTALVPASGLHESPHVTSWSACLDDQTGLETNAGGMLVGAFVTILRGNRSQTHGQLLNALSRKLLMDAKEAKPWCKENNIHLVCPKPQLGSLRKIDDILDMPFSF